MNIARLIFEVIPVLLAIGAIFTCTNRALTTRRIHDRKVYLGMVVCAFLMIAAQSSWMYSFMKGDLLGTDAANILWTAFNIGTMSIFMLSARRSKE